MFMETEIASETVCKDMANRVVMTYCKAWWRLAITLWRDALMRSWWIITEGWPARPADSLNTSDWGKRLASATRRAWCNHVTVIENDRSGRLLTGPPNIATLRDRCALALQLRLAPK